MSANLSAILYLVSGVLFILALRGLSSPETSRQGNLFGIIGMVNCCNSYISYLLVILALDLFMF